MESSDCSISSIGRVGIVDKRLFRVGRIGLVDGVSNLGFEIVRLGRSRAGINTRLLARRLLSLLLWLDGLRALFRLESSVGPIGLVIRGQRHLWDARYGLCFDRHVLRRTLGFGLCLLRRQAARLPWHCWWRNRGCPSGFCSIAAAIAAAVMARHALPCSQILAAITQCAVGLCFGDSQLLVYLLSQGCIAMRCRNFLYSFQATTDRCSSAGLWLGLFQFTLCRSSLWYGRFSRRTWLLYVDFWWLLLRTSRSGLARSRFIRLGWWRAQTR